MSDENSEAADHLAVRIKHRGACPHEKGHGDGVGLACFIFGLLAGLWIAMMFAAIIGLHR